MFTLMNVFTVKKIKSVSTDKNKKTLKMVSAAAIIY